MEQTKEQKDKENLSVYRVIDGRPYTVRVHYPENAEETAQDKMRRILARSPKIADLR